MFFKIGKRERGRRKTVSIIPQFGDQGKTRTLIASDFSICYNGHR
jgi:hypothetical protein